MDIFISWSGQKSQKVAEIFKNWLPQVIQVIKPYFSPTDIDKGAAWFNEIQNKISSTSFGIIILTRDNLNAPWILFEAGAISKAMEVNRICPILVDLKATDLIGPLAQYQASSITKEEIWQLLEAINRNLDVHKLEVGALQKSFDKWWNDLKESIEDVNNSIPTDNQAEIRTDRELIEEILRLSRKRTYPNFINKKSNSLSRALGGGKNVEYDQSDKKIIIWINQTHSYDIYLDDLCSGSQLLDTILQINRKGFVNGDVLEEFLEVIEQLSDSYFNKNAQGIFCPFGENMSVNWTS